MGKLIDTDRLKEVFGKNVVGGSAYFDLIDNAPSVEAISKADYETRLKADIVAMLEEISLEFDEQYHVNRHELHDDFLNRGLEQGQSIIQQKIDALKGEQA